jgi:hypothetical protein
MFQAARKHMRAIAMLGVAAALVVGGVAAAQGESQSDSNGSQAAGSRPPGPPPFGGPMLMTKDLTYAEVHVQKDGKAETIRIDQGKIAAVDGSSVTLTENDGNEVTIPVDSETKILAKPGEESTLGDLAVGQQVTVSGPDGGTAESIMVMPKKGELKVMTQGGPMPPPPGAAQGEQQGPGN